MSPFLFWATATVAHKDTRDTLRLLDLPPAQYWLFRYQYYSYSVAECTHYGNAVTAMVVLTVISLALLGCVYVQSYVTVTYLGITAPSSSCPGSPNTTVMLLKEIAATGLCSQVQFDTHIQPGPDVRPSNTIPHRLLGY